MIDTQNVSRETFLCHEKYREKLKDKNRVLFIEQKSKRKNLLTENEMLWNVCFVKIGVKTEIHFTEKKLMFYITHQLIL